MYLFLGQETVVRARDIVGIFDLDNTSVSALTKDFLKKAQGQGKIIEVSPGELPKSFVVCGERGGGCVYLSQISPATLKKRMAHSG
ncbi:MAG: DUF370 domain-containing protein [Oscillospiraceae bacterium]|nr:DUF370 domain-containing protein [Oscillospiraceae bacterium]